MFDATVSDIRALIPGLRFWRDRLRAKIERSKPGPHREVMEEELDEVVTLLKGFLSIAGDPEDPRRNP